MVTYLGAPTPPPRSPQRKKTIITVSVVSVIVLALLGGVGAWAAVRFWYGSGDQPEKAMPATVFEYARVDLDPSLDQTTKMLNILRKFPSVKENSDSDISGTEKSIFDSLGFSDLTYSADVEPWFDHKIGAGIWADPSNDHELYGLIVMSSSDDDKATSAMAKAVAQQDNGEVGYSVSDGWALMALGESGAQGAADRAAAEAAENNLADSSAFSSSLSSLPDGQVAISWSDFDGLADEIDYASEQSSYSDLSGFTLPDVLASSHLLTAIQASGSGLELRLRLDGLTAQSPLGTTALQDLGALSGDSVLALAGGFSADADSDYVDEINTLFGGYEDDTAAAIVDAQTVTLSMLDFAEDSVQLAVTSRTSSAAQTIGDVVAEAVSSSQMTADQNGLTTVLQGDDYEDSNTKLSDQSLFQTTMADMPSGAGLAGYFDFEAYATLNGADSDLSDELEPLKAVGFGVAGKDTEMTALIRVVID